MYSDLDLFKMKISFSNRNKYFPKGFNNVWIEVLNKFLKIL
jgi:hypothetical protein